MANIIYRDIACANGHEYHYAILSRLLLNGWTTVAWSNGSTRTAGASPAAATDLNAANAWWVIQHTMSGRKLHIKRRADSNTWDIQVTPGGYALTTGTSTTPDNNASYTKFICNNRQSYPSTGTTATKLHLVVSDSSAAFQSRLRRTPFVGGSTASCTILNFGVFTDVQWSSNPDPCVYTSIFDDANNADANLFTTSNYSFAWVRLGIAGEAWVGNVFFENPGTCCGSGTSSPGGTDQLYELRWCTTSLPGPLGKATQLWGLQPYRAPTTGVDSGGTLTHAAFGYDAIPNDGVALGS
jgi:hypothetical protein